MSTYAEKRIKVYRDQVTGSFYKYEFGELVQYPMKLDGTMDNKTSCSVDWDEALFACPVTTKGGKEVDVYKHLKRIERKLRGSE